MNALLLMILFATAALVALAVLGDCALKARLAVFALREAHARGRTDAGVRISITSWRVVENAVVALPPRRAFTLSRFSPYPEPDPELAFAA